MSSTCPTCDATVNLQSDTEVSEIVSCADCQTRLVVESLAAHPRLALAPAIEEDWGE